jgi:hypothetical protein
MRWEREVEPGALHAAVSLLATIALTLGAGLKWN